MAGILAEHHKEVEWNEQALALYRARDGEDSPAVAKLRNNLGEAWRKLGKYKKAIGYYEKALTAFERSLGADHPYTKSVAENLARAKAEIDDPVE